MVWLSMLIAGFFIGACIAIVGFLMIALSDDLVCSLGERICKVGLIMAVSCLVIFVVGFALAIVAAAILI